YRTPAHLVSISAAPLVTPACRPTTRPLTQSTSPLTLATTACVALAAPLSSRLRSWLTRSPHLLAPWRLCRTRRWR
ncbi:Os05g0132300, partial [Oryza sativa Japonica Group]